VDIATGAWRLDPARSSVEFHVRNFYGLMTVKGTFASYEGRVDLNADPAIELTVDAASVDTKQAKRDKHLRSADFFDVESHPQVLFSSDAVALEDGILTVTGQLQAAGQQVPVHLDAQLSAVGEELEVHAETHVDHRLLGMTWSPIGILRAPSKLVVQGRLVRAG
jgi:polyisoprenoid-binding protein YceI